MDHILAGLAQVVEREGQEPGPRRGGVHARLVVQIGHSLIDIDKTLPMGETTEETLAHIQALVVGPALDLAKRLIAAHFEAIRYALDGEEGA